VKVLVTGGCGLIGYHASKYFHEQGHEVVVMDNMERSSLLGHKVSPEREMFNAKLLTKMGVQVWTYDVSLNNSFNMFEEMDYIVHLAGQCGVPTSIENPRRDMEVNLIGTFNVLELARRTGAAVAFASTNKVYPIHDGFRLNDETNKWEFDSLQYRHYGFPVVNDLVGSRTPYGWSKYSADLLCQEYAHTYGVKTGVFRMSCIYGPNQFGFEEQGWATWFVIAAQKRKEITIYGDGKQTRDMLYVEDCVKAYDAFFKSPLTHGVFNLGGGPDNVLSLNECIEHLGIYSKSFIGHAPWRPSDQRSYVSDIRPLNLGLGWKPEVSPFEGLGRVQDWVEENESIF
jgi:CDP-paratose 2-epimerase